MKYYRAPVCYDPASSEPFLLSRSKIELYFNCQRCFYLEFRHGIRHPSSFPYTLNNAVDKLLRAEFEYYRAHQIKPPIIAENKIPAMPAILPKFVGTTGWQWGKISALHQPTNFIVYGLIDDLWISDANEYHIVDYKATANVIPVTSLQRDYHITYKRQAEMYQWILRQNKLIVSDTAYFVYCTANPEGLQFAGRLNFTISVIPYVSSTAWIEPALVQIKNLLNGEIIPEYNAECRFCFYQQKIQSLIN